MRPAATPTTRTCRSAARWGREYLVQKGIAPQRLGSEGIGMEKPIDINATAEGRANNRHVGFVVVE